MNKILVGLFELSVSEEFFEWNDEDTKVRVEAIDKSRGEKFNTLLNDDSWIFFFKPTCLGLFSFIFYLISQ